MRVLLIAGGWSPERAVSLDGAKGIRKALLELGHEPVDFDPLSDGMEALPGAARACDFAFFNLHGEPGEDGLLQAMLDRVGCPYQGSAPAGSFLALHKAAAKAVLRDAGLPTPDWEFLPVRPEAGWRLSLAYPVFVKPDNGGSSLHMTLVREEKDLGPALETVYALGREAVIEAYIEGVEITCGVLDQEPLPPIMIRPKNGAAFFDYESKYVAGKCDEICPAPLDDATTKKIQDLALAAHRALGLTGYSRADFILTPGGEAWLLEVNTLPGMTATSLVPQEAQVLGMSFADLIQRLIDLGLARSGGSR